MSQQRTRIDFARCVRELIDIHYPDAERIVLVLDQRNTHSPASFYTVFSPSEARRLTEKVEIHHTPEHGSWLNMAELELSVLARQCLAQRLPACDAMQAVVTAWADRRNATDATIDWQFTTAEARTELRRLYSGYEA